MAYGAGRARGTRSSLRSGAANRAQLSPGCWRRRNRGKTPDAGCCRCTRLHHTHASPHRNYLSDKCGYATSISSGCRERGLDGGQRCGRGGLRVPSGSAKTSGRSGHSGRPGIRQEHRIRCRDARISTEQPHLRSSHVMLSGPPAAPVRRLACVHLRTQGDVAVPNLLVLLGPPRPWPARRTDSSRQLPCRPAT